MRHIFTCLWPLLIAMGAFITFTPPPVVAMPPDVVASTTSEKPVLVNEALDIDFWERAAQLGNLARKYAESRISEVQSTYPHYIEEVGTIKDGISQMVSCATGFKALIKQTSLHTARDTSNSETVSDDISSEALVDDIVDKVDKILAELLEELSAAFPPPDHATHHAEREIQVSKILGKAEDAIPRICVEASLPEEEVREQLKFLHLHIVTVVVTIGDITEQHPDLVEILLITAVFMIIPEGWILRPVARLFGIGPYGPVKGSTAAWAQRTFYGAEVKAGSWFAHLQRAGMKPMKPIADTIMKWLGRLGCLFWKCS